MSISGLMGGSIQAKLAQIKQRGQQRLEAGLAKIDAAHNDGLAKVDAAMTDVEAKIQHEIDNQLQEFAQSTNGPEA